MTDIRVLRLAKQIADDKLAQYNEYLADGEFDRRNGHRAHYCEHGTNQWTDYDNICGGCEDGYTNGDGLQRRQAALYQAHGRVEKADALFKAMRALVSEVGWDAVNLKPISDRINVLLRNEAS